MIHLYPNLESLTKRAEQTPRIMVPTIMPSVVVVVGALTPIECDEIQDFMETVEGYDFNVCGAHLTREVYGNDVPECLRKMERVTRNINDTVFQFKVNEDIWVWHQSYVQGGSYVMHKDSSYGQSRKLSSILQLSAPGEYVGGNLEVIPFPDRITVPREKGTLAVFPAWVLHQVSDIMLGSRSSINMGFFGPPFR